MMRTGFIGFHAAVIALATSTYGEPIGARRHEPVPYHKGPITQAERNRLINASAARKRANSKRKSARRQRKA